MKNILLYGNCQMDAIKKTLNLPTDLYNLTVLLCFSTDIDRNNYLDIIKNSDIIITQPIQDNYRDVDYLSTNFIINNSKDSTKIIIVNSAYFNFYYFDLTYTYFNEKLLQTPTDYHYNKMIECYKNNFSEDYYIENYVNNANLKTKEELENMVSNSLNELKIRYENSKEKYSIKNVFFIPLYEFINKNYKDQLLFYSMNHPTKYVIQYICLEIIHYLEIHNSINFDIDIFNFMKCILYKCIQKQVNFDINEYTPSMMNKTNSNEITKLYYSAYNKINFF